MIAIFFLSICAFVCPLRSTGPVPLCSFLSGHLPSLITSAREGSQGPGPGTGSKDFPAASRAEILADKLPLGLGAEPRVGSRAYWTEFVGPLLPSFKSIVIRGNFCSIYLLSPPPLSSMFVVVICCPLDFFLKYIEREKATAIAVLIESGKINHSHTRTRILPERLE